MGYSKETIQKFFEALDSLVDDDPIDEVIYYSKETINKFFNALKSLVDDSMDEKFSSENNSRRHYRDHVLGPNAIKKSTKTSLYYDHMTFEEYMSLENKYFTLTFDEEHTITTPELGDSRCLTKVDNLFDNDEYLVIEGADSDLYVFAPNKNTVKNYTGSDKIYDFYVKDLAHNHTRTLYPISESSLLNKVFSILFFRL